MINVSNEFLETMEERTDFMEAATITFTNGDVLEVEGDDFTLSNNSLTDAAGTSNFPLGVALEKTIQIELMNEDDHLWGYDFSGAKIQLKLSFQLSETVETLDYGTYTVLTPETYGTTVLVTATDDMHLADTDYETNLEFPCTLREIVQDSCHTTGIYLLSTTFRNDDFVVLEKPESLTHREVIAQAAMIACGYARMDYQGRLVITSYDTSMFDTTDGLDGGYFDNPDLDNSIELEGGVFDTDSSTIYTSGTDATGGSFNPWEEGESYNGGSPEQYVSGDWADGGSFNPWDEGDELSGGSFEDMATYQNLYNFAANGLKTDLDDVVITGIQIEKDDGDDKQVYLCGEEGYILGIENDLAEDKEEEVVSLIGAALIGLRFRPFEGDHISYPIAEYGDIAQVSDRRGRMYQSVITDINFTFRGFTTFKCSAESPIRNSSTYASSSEYVKAVKAARKETVEMITEYDKAVQMLADLITNSFGVFKTEELQEDGSVIYYLHDKPTLDESTTIWKMTADAFAVSTDGGKTWNAGMDSQGNVTANVLSVIGINFDWAHGGTLTLGGYNNDYGWMKILDANGSQIGKWDKDGITVNAGSLSIGSYFNVTNSGVITASSGTIGGWYITSTRIRSSSDVSIGGSVPGLMLINESDKPFFNAQDGNGKTTFQIDRDGSATFAGTLSAATGTFAGSLSAATGTFAGSLSAASGTFTGTLSAATGSFSGSITATSGTIGGWYITSTRIRSSSTISSGSSEAGILMINEPSDEKPWFRAQNSRGSLTFQIDYDGSATFAGALSAATGTFAGSLSAATGTFAGSLSAATGSFSGSITATSGYIGSTQGWHIGSTYIYNGPTSLSSTTEGTYVGIDGINNNAMYNGDMLIGDESSHMMHITLSDGALTIVDESESPKTITVVNGAGFATKISGGTNYCLSATGVLIAGTTTLSSLTVSGNTTLNNLRSLTVSGTSTLSSTLSVSGAATLSSTLNVTGRINANSTGSPSFRCYGSASIDKDLYVDGDLVVLGSSYQNSIDSPATLEAYDKVFDELDPVIFSDTVSKGKTIGFTYGETAEAVKDAGIDPDDSPLVKTFEDEETGEVEGGVNYTQLVAMLVYEVQNLKEEVKELKAQLSK